MDSQAIVNTMEVLETKPLSELVTEATVKVCYVSETPNPNQTVINRETGKEIAATLPGAPVVGLFDPETNDFVEHSRRLSIKDGEIKWEELTRPYGFVSPIHKPWYQDFMENGENRTYLMCKAFLWTRQYKEASLINDKGQSMELDEKDMSGYYEGDVFIFTHATLDKLCILGDKYAPCFEGAKFMTTYAKGYNSLAEEVESIIGRRYYVLNDKLVEKPVTLDYAVQMGWNLEDAIYAQLVTRGAELRYHIQGIYAENNETFVILQEIASQEYVKVSLEITNADTVILGADMIAVSMKWIPKPFNMAAETPASTTSTMQTGSNTYAADGNPVEPIATPVPEDEGIQNQGTVVTEPTEVTPVEPATVEEGQQIADTAVANAAAVIDDASQVADTEPTGVEPVTQETGIDTGTSDTTPTEGEQTGADGADGAGEGESNSEGEGDGADGAGDPAPAADFAALTEKVASLEQQIAEKTLVLASLSQH